jgi:peptide subunit release factor 1 (eRF1)
MISYEDIRDLQQYHSQGESFVLSVYVNTDQSQAANRNRGFRTVIEGMLRGLADKELVNGGKIRFETERKRVLDFVSQHTPHGKGLVIFSDSVSGFWWQRDLQVSVPTEARWSPKPWVRPLLEIMGEREPLGVVLIDKQRAKIFLMDATGIELKSEIASEVPNKHQTTGTDHIWSQSHMDRDHIKHIKWHARQVAEAFVGIADNMKLRQVVIAGPVEATTIFQNELPKRVQQMVISTLPVSIDISLEKLAAEIHAVQEKAELEEESSLVEMLITTAHKSNRAVLGLPDTLSAIQQGRVYKLILNRSFRIEGLQCNSCGVLVIDQPESCPFCRGTLEKATDLVNRASHLVVEQGGEVRPISGKAADVLAGAGGIGAILRT